MADALAQHLVSRGLLSPERVDEAVRRQAIAGGTLDTALLEMGAISEAGILQALADVSGLRLVNLADFEPNTEVAALIPPRVADRLCVVPLSIEGAALHAAVGYPVPTPQLQEVGFLLGKQLELWIGLEVRIRDWMSRLYRQPMPVRFTTLLAMLDPDRPVELTRVKRKSDRPVPPPPPLPQPPADDGGTLEDQLMEPVRLEAKKPKGSPPSPRPSELPPTPKLTSLPANVYDHMETVVLDAGAYDAYAKQVTKTKGGIPPGDEPWRVRHATDDATTIPMVPIPPGAAGPVPLGSDEPRPTVRDLKVVERAAAMSASDAQDYRNLPFDPPAAEPPPQAAGEDLERTREFGRPSKEAMAQMKLQAAYEAPTEGMTAVVDVPPDWSLGDAREHLKHASRERDAIIDVALRFARRTFDFAAAFAVLRGSAVGWDARGDQADRALMQSVSFPLDAQSVFRTVALSRGSYVGPLPADPLTRPFLEQLGRGPRTIFLFPVEVRQRLVAILYGDSGQKQVSQRRLSDLLLFCQDLPGAFQELILSRKRTGSGALAELAPPAPVRHGGWSPSGATVPSGVGRAAAMHAVLSLDSEQAPSDFGPILKRLTGHDAAQRARALAELARTPEQASRALAQQFPGPTAWSRMPVMELPEAEELGPIPAAFARLGRKGAAALAPLLDHADPDTRYFALLTAGNVPYPEVVDGVLRGLFDYEPDLSSAARVAATALRKLPRFELAMKDLRQELASHDSLRRSLAARALGVLHDRASVEGLIGLTGSDDQMVAQIAAEALREITRAPLAPQPRLWQAWWAENRSRRRVDWLIAGLRSKELEVRLATIEELSRAFHDDLGYVADGPSAERDSAVARWEQLLAQRVPASLDL